jgi:hypothetical protein
MRYRWLLTLVVLLAALSLVPASPTQAVGDARCFRETGQCINASFRRFWEQNGGLRIFGFPIQSQIGTTIDGRRATSQLFERARFQQFVDVRNAPVTLGNVGIEALELQGIYWQDFAPIYDPDAVARGECTYYGATNHAVCYGFRDFYNRNGGNRIFGNPISDEIVEGDRVIQWFERGRFEYYLYDPQLARLGVLLGLVGTELNV